MSIVGRKNHKEEKKCNTLIRDFRVTKWTRKKIVTKSFCLLVNGVNAWANYIWKNFQYVIGHLELVKTQKISQLCLVLQIVLNGYKLFWSGPNRFGQLQIILVRFKLDFYWLIFKILTWPEWSGPESGFNNLFSIYTIKKNILID